MKESSTIKYTKWWMTLFCCFCSLC
jgi:hypothetical protein